MKKTILLLILFSSAIFLCAQKNKIDDADIWDALKDLPKKKLPKELTEKNWKKNKSKWAKLFKKKTGLTKALKKLEDTFEKISDKNRKNFLYPDPHNKKYTSSEDFQKMYLEKYDTWKQLAKFIKQLKTIEELAEEAHENFKKSKIVPKKTTALAKKVQEEAKELHDKLEGIPKKWKKKFSKTKEISMEHLMIVDDIKKSGIKPDQVQNALFLLDKVIFNGAIEGVCDTYLSNIVPQLEEKRSSPEELAELFNKIVVGKDAGSRKISQNTSNIRSWKDKFGKDFIYSTDEIKDEIELFHGWGGNTRTATKDNAVSELDAYIKGVKNVQKWAKKYKKQWEEDKKK